MNLIDLKERIALSDAFTPQERDFILDAINQMTMEWTCGHASGAVCRECYRELAARAHQLADENLRFRERLSP